MDSTLVGVPFWVLGLACLVPAAVFAIFWPRRHLSGAAHALLRWGHSATWILLSASCFTRAVAPGENGGQAAHLLALAGLAVYLGFLAVMLRNPQST